MMKRILSIIFLLMVAVLLGSCKLESGFTFNGHHFGDTMEQVKQAEGNNGVFYEDDRGDYMVFLYQNAEVAELTGDLFYVFKENKLKYIRFLCPVPDSWLAVKDTKNYEDIKKNMANTYEMAKNKLSFQYGSIDQEGRVPSKSGNDSYKALWKKNDYGIVLFATEILYINLYSDPDKSEESFNTDTFSLLID